jgi:magnesium-transporting ATPase (P-type)
MKESVMKSYETCILPINGGSWSIMFALFETAYRGEYRAVMERTMRWTVSMPHLTKSPAEQRYEIPNIEPKTDQSTAPDSKLGSRSTASGDLQSLPMSELQTTLRSSPDGLSQAEAQQRLTRCGPNEIEEKTTNLFLKFLPYFWEPIPWMIEAAAILSAVDRHWPDFFIIFVLLLANAVAGFWEEY